MSFNDWWLAHKDQIRPPRMEDAAREVWDAAVAAERERSGKGGGGSAGFSIVAEGGGMGGLVCPGEHEWRPIFGGHLGGGEACSRCGIARGIRQAPAE